MVREDDADDTNQGDETMARGLYGQTESDAGTINATSQRYADVEGEGLRTSDGSFTEQGFRVRLSKAADVEMKASQGENRAMRGTAPSLVKMIEARGYRGLQKDALDQQGAIAGEMKAAGFGHGNIMAALTIAAPLAFAQRAVEAKGIRGALDPNAPKIKSRTKPRMYSLERDALINADGSVKV